MKILQSGEQAFLLSFKGGTSKIQVLKIVTAKLACSVTNMMNAMIYNVILDGTDLLIVHCD
jgi:hypothetical protein